MRVVYWNIRAGGGVRAPWIAAQIARWRPDVVGLCEYRGTPPSHDLSLALAGHGLVHQRRAIDATHLPRNGLLLASRRPVRRVRLRGEPAEPCRWLLVKVAGGPSVGVLHAPNFVTGRKRPFFDAVARIARRWRGGPAILGGDTNTGVPPLDGNPAAFHDWEIGWIHDLDAAGWRDAYRQRHPVRRAPTWFSPNAGNGYRLDQAFVNGALLDRLAGVRHAWGRAPGEPPRRDALSDHAALIVDLEP